MSNLSLSFSFYFWWINCALIVTLTNSLSQSVSVIPDNVFNTWYGNNLDNPYGTLTAGAFHVSGGNDGNEGHLKSPTLTLNVNSFSASETKDGSYDTCGFVYYPSVINFANISKLYFRVKNARIYGSTTAYQSVAINIVNQIANQYTRLKELTLVAQGGTQGADVSIQNIDKMIDVSSLSGNGYLMFYLRSIGSIEIEAIWYD